VERKIAFQDFLIVCKDGLLLLEVVPVLDEGENLLLEKKLMQKKMQDTMK